MSAEKIDLVELQTEAGKLVALLRNTEDSSGRNRAINTQLVRILELVLSEQEVELLKFNEKNPNMLRDPWGIKSVTRVPDTEAPKTEIIKGE